MERDFPVKFSVLPRPQQLEVLLDFFSVRKKKIFFSFATTLVVGWRKGGGGGGIGQSARFKICYLTTNEH